jgi:hypothetical protein
MAPDSALDINKELGLGNNKLETLFFFLFVSDARTSNLQPIQIFWVGSDLAPGHTE